MSLSVSHRIECLARRFLRLISVKSMVAAFSIVIFFCVRVHFLFFVSFHFETTDYQEGFLEFVRFSECG